MDYLQKEKTEQTRGTILIKFVFILILATLCVYLALPTSAEVLGRNIAYRLGLDLQGGTHLIYQGDLSNLDASLTGDAMDSVRDVIERRVNAFGVSEPVVQVSGSDRLIVELPGVHDIDEAVEQIGQTPFLEFREENLDIELPADPENFEEIDVASLFTPTELTGAHLQRAEVTFGGATAALSAPEVTLIFNSEGRELFRAITERNIGRRVAIFLDGELVSAPVVQTAIPDGQAVITGNFSLPEARELVQRLNAGALPVPISLLSQQNIGPSLGKISIHKSLVAGIIGLSSVVLFMIIYYGIPGIVASLALAFYAVLSLSLFKLLGFTLSLASISGFILSIGIAIDANILIFERTREELRAGKSLKSSLAEGYLRAWPSVRDSNVSSLITALVLVLGTGFVRGFAIALTLGIIVSMFTAITVTRTLLSLLSLMPAFNKPSVFGIKS